MKIAVLPILVAFLQIRNSAFAYGVLGIRMSSWERMWSSGDGLKAGQAFDASRSSPALTQVIQTLPASSVRRTALVPGCGRGYDVIEFAKAGIDAYGIDLAPTAIRSALDYSETIAKSDLKGSVNFVAGDLLSADAEIEGLPSQFDFIYDYTFLCALDPSLRKRWASTMKRSLKPSGELITLIFPLGDYQGGPPYAMSIDLVKSLLEGEGFESTYLEPVPQSLSHAGRGGKEALGRWRVKI